MRITADVVSEEGRVRLTPFNERQISLRGLKILQIENLGTTRDQFGVLDLSDNAISVMDGFPRLENLKILYINNNRLTSISPSVFDFLPNLQSLSLYKNLLMDLKSIAPIAQAKKLERLTLGENELTTIKPDVLNKVKEVLPTPLAEEDEKDLYRLAVISMLPKLRYLDFGKVSNSDRLRASRVFEGHQGELLRHILFDSSQT